MSTSDYTVSSIPEVKEALETNHIEKLIGVASTSYLTAFITSSFFPILLNFQKEGKPEITFLKGEPKGKPECTCIDISEDKKYIAVGHIDGSISIWSIAEGTLVKQFQQLHEKSITAIAFGHDSETLFVGDSAGLATWVSISLVFGFISMKEILLAQGDSPVRQLCFTRVPSLFEIGFIVYDARFITIDPKVLTSMSKKLVFQCNINTSMTYLDPPCLHLIHTDGHTPCVALTAGSKFYCYQCSSDHRLVFWKGFDIEGGYVDFNIPISEFLIAFISKAGFISLNSIHGKEIFRTNDSNISEIVKNLRSISSSSEKLILLTDEDCSSMSFMGYEERLQQIAEDNWEAALQIGDRIFNNEPTELVGLPLTLSQRRSVIQDAMTAIMTKQCQTLLDKNESDENLIKALKIIVSHCITVEETEFLTTRLYKQFKAAHRLTPFFEGIFGSDISSDPLGICTASFVSSYIKYAAYPNAYLKEISEKEKPEEKTEETPQISEKTEETPQISEKTEETPQISEKTEETPQISEKTEETPQISEKADETPQISEKEEKPEEKAQKRPKISETEEIEKEPINFESLKKAEDILLKLPFEKGQARKIVRDAYECKMYRLTIRIAEKYIKDYVLACSIAFEAGPDYLLEIIKRVFFDKKDFYEDSVRKTIAMWAFFPERDEFKRLDAIFNANWDLSGSIVQEFLGLLPIPYSFTSSLSLTEAIDVILRVVEKYDSKKVMSILEEVCPIYAIQGEVFTGVALPKVIDWIFLSEKDTPQRQTVLKIILEKYPGIIPAEDLFGYSVNCGFIDCVLDALLPEKAYTQIIGTALLSPDFSDKVFEIIDDHIGEDKRLLKDAVLANFNALLLTNPTQTAAIVVEYFPELKEEMRRLPPLEKWLFLNELIAIEDQTPEEDLLVLFELVCQFNPSAAISFLNEHPDIDPDKAEKIAEKLGRVDCAIQILEQTARYDKAVESIAKEVQTAILAFEETVDDIQIGSVDELADNPQIAPAFQTIRVAIDLLYNVTETNIFKQWDRIYKCFQLPLYHMQKKKEGIAQAVVMLFSYFVVESLNVLDAEIVFLVLSIYFGALNIQQYRMLLRTIFARIEYQTNLYNSVEELLTNDCLSLVDKAFIKITKGLQSDQTCRCQACQRPLSKGTIPFYIFPCGHCFHKQSECGFPEKKEQKQEIQSNDTLVVSESEKGKANENVRCPICSGGKNSVSVLSNNDGGKMSTRRIQQLMRRMEFALRKNYGTNSEAASNGNEAFFAKKDVEEYGNNSVVFAMMGIPSRSIAVQVQVEEPEQQKSI